MEDSADEGGLKNGSHAKRILAGVSVPLRFAQLGVLTVEFVVRIRPMPGRAVTITARIAFLFCGLVSLFTAVPYSMLRGIDLPVQSEWVLFVVALVPVGALSVTIAVLPRSWIAKVCRMDRDDDRLFSAPLKVLGALAAMFYLVAVVAFFAPSRWSLNPQLMLSLCPMYFVKMTFDPSSLMIFLLLAPMNAAVYGAFGLTLGYAWLLVRERT
jgi:hypothetical protein